MSPPNNPQPFESRAAVAATLLRRVRTRSMATLAVGSLAAAMLVVLYRQILALSDSQPEAARRISLCVLGLLVASSTLAAGWARSRGRRQVRRSLSQFVEDMRRIADGDLTPHIEAEGYLTGPLAEILSAAVGRLRHTLARTQQLSVQLSQSAGQIHAGTEKLSKESEIHAAQIHDTSAAVSEIVESIRLVADNTQTSADVAEEARRTAASGSRAVANTMQGMEKIRDQVQATSKRIKQLGESSQQIGEIVKLISDVADRTSLLALNASIQAAMAGEAGRGFGVVAEEVEHLSQRCNEATRQIAALVRGIQTETAKAIAGMEESIAEVVEGSKLASQAGEALAEIDAVSDRLAELIQSISVATKQQVRGGLLASRSIHEISSVMHDDAIGTRQVAQSVTGLVALVDGLSRSLGRFQMGASVPATPRQPATTVPAAANATIQVPWPMSDQAGTSPVHFAETSTLS